MEVSRYDLEQGLPQSMVNHVVQDADGFIWLGTGDGIARFDGSRFVVYKHDPRDSTSIADNRIWGIAEAGPDHLWVGTRGSLERLDRRTGRFERMCVGSRNGVNGCWQPISTGPNGSVFYSPLTAETLTISGGDHHRQPTGHVASYCMRTSADGRILHSICYSDSLITTDLTTGVESVQRIPLDPGDKLMDMIAHGKGWLFLTARSGWILDEQGRRAELPAALRRAVNGAGQRKYVQRDTAGRLWIGLSGRGVLVVRQDLSIDRTYALRSSGTGTVDITTIQFDRQGNTWVGTDGQGVFKIAPQRIKFGRCMPGLGLPWEPPSWFVRDFVQWDDHRLLVSFHQGGLAWFDERSNELAPYTVPGRTPDISWTRMLNDASGLVWLKDERGVVAVDPRNGMVVSEPPDTKNAILIHDSIGNVLLVKGGRVTAWGPDRPGMPGAQRTGSAALAAFAGRPGRFHIDPSGQWWASAHELSISVWKNDHPIAITGKYPVPAARMMNLFPTGDGRAWMTTDDGLLRWSLSPPVLLEQITIHEGLPDQFLYGMIPEGDDSWWISSNNGLSRFDTERAVFRNYTGSDGLQSREFNVNAWFRSRSGRIYFGGVNGFNHFTPGSVQDDPDSALVHVIGLANKGGAIALPTGAGPSVLLPYPRNELRIDVAVLEFTAPDRNTMRWRLRGYDAAWTAIAANVPIELSNVPDGEFVLEAVGINGDGVEGGTRELLRIVVERPFWANPWSIALLVAFLVSIIAWLWMRASRRRMLRRLAESEREVRELRLRTRLAKDIHDDVGSGLARMAALSRSTKRGIDPEARFEKLAGISGELLENLRDVVWMNDPRNDTLDAVLLRIREHANDLFEESGATVRCDFPDPLPTRTIHGSFRRNLFLIAKEALHNAHKYSGARHITLRWEENASDFLFELIDDGGGITGGIPQGSGHGTDNMRERAVEMGARYERPATSGGGTTVRLTNRP